MCLKPSGGPVGGGQVLVYLCLSLNLFGGDFKTAWLLGMICILTYYVTTPLNYAVLLRPLRCSGSLHLTVTFCSSGVLQKGNYNQKSFQDDTMSCVTPHIPHWPAFLTTPAVVEASFKGATRDRKLYDAMRGAPWQPWHSCCTVLSEHAVTASDNE